MKVVIGEKTYYVKWEHREAPHPRVVAEVITKTGPVSKHPMQRKTACYIFEGVANTELITAAYVTCYHKDTYDKEKGRRISLQRALEPYAEGAPAPFNKQERGLFWEAYRVMSKKPKWSTK